MNFIYLKSYGEKYKEIARLGLPIVVGQLGIVVVGFADNLMVGRFGLEHLAAVSFVNSVFTIPILFGLGFSYGLTPLVGQAFGRGAVQEVGTWLKNSLLVNGCVGIVMTLAMAAVLLNLESMGQPEELLPLIRPYFILQLVSLVFVMLFNAFKQFADGITDTRTPMYIMLTANVLNIIGNYILIYGKWGFPALGATGAGISTLFARIFMFAAFAWFFAGCRRYRPYRLAWRAGQYGRKAVKMLNKMGMMVGLQMGIENGLFSITGVMIGWLGSAALAAHQIILSVSTLGVMLYYGAGAAIAVKVSNCYGQGDMGQVRQVSTAGRHVMTAMMVVIVGIFLLLRQVMGALFMASGEVTEVVETLMLMLLTLQVGDVFQITYANALRGMGDVTPMALISFFGYFVVALPLCYWGGFILGGGVAGVWIGYPVGLLLTGLLLMWRFYRIAGERREAGQVEMAVSGIRAEEKAAR